MIQLEKMQIQSSSDVSVDISGDSHVRQNNHIQENGKPALFEIGKTCTTTNIENSRLQKMTA